MRRSFDLVVMSSCGYATLHLSSLCLIQFSSVLLFFVSRFFKCLES